MKNSLLFSLRASFFAAVLAASAQFSASAQQIAYDEAGNYVVNGNWTNGANLGTGFTPWAILTNGPDFNGTYIQSANSPTFVIASLTNILGTNYPVVWGLFANGTTGINETTCFRGFNSTLGTNTFKIQWGSRGAGSTVVNNLGTQHGWCGFTLRSGNATNSADDFQNGVRLYFYFKDGNAPSTLYFWDDNSVQSIPNTSFSDLGRNNITNAVEVEVTPGADGSSYHMVVKDTVQNRTIFTTNGTFIGGAGTEDSVALFNQETTGDQVYNRMQITSSTNVPPQVVNVQPADGSIYLTAANVAISFEVDSFNSTVSSNQVTVLLNGVSLAGTLSFNTTSPTTQLLGASSASVAPDTFYTLQVIAQDANGNIITNTTTFNTFLATDLYIDASDYNYTNGLFVNSPTPFNDYVNLIGNQNVDYFQSNTNGTNNIYRPGDLPQVLSLNTDASGDPIDHANLRQNGGTAFNIGFTDVGTWENYTRTFSPSTNYSIYARAASAGGGQFEIEKLVNSTATVSNQASIALGRVNVPITGGSKVFSGQLQPLTDIFGNTVVVPFSGVNTIRATAISNDGYNLEYLVCVAITNATSPLRPYIATGSPGPGATSVGILTPITFAIANRQTTVTPASIQVILTLTNGLTTNVTSKLALSNNAAGTIVTFTPSNNFPANATNTVTVIYADSASVNVTNSWSFITSGNGGIVGSGVWSGGGADQNWSTAANWTGGTPGPGSSATFASPGGTSTRVTNNIVSTNVTIATLTYATNTAGFHTTLISNGVTLTVSNGATTTTSIMQVGGGFQTSPIDNTFNGFVTNTITGIGGTLLIMGNDPRSGGAANNWNFQVRQCANPSAPYQTTLDMSGLGTFSAIVGKFYLAQGGSGAFQSNVSAQVFLARTNSLTLLRFGNAGQFEVGDSSGGAFTLPGSALYLGITNALFIDTARIGKQKATNNLIAFNPTFTNGLTPVTYLRGTNATPGNRLNLWTVGDADTDTVVPIKSQGATDFSGGRLDALIGQMIIGRNSTSASDTGFAQGAFIFTAGALDVTNLQVGVQRAASAAPATGSMIINGSASLSSANIVLAQAFAGGTPSLVTGNLNVTNGTVRGNITAGGGNSIVNLIGGTLAVSNNAGTTAAPIQSLNLASASLHLKADGNATTTNIVATSVTTSGTTTITIDSVANVTGPTTIHLLGYAGTDPFAGLALAPLPGGFAGNLVDNPGSVDLNVTVSAVPPAPTIQKITISGGQLVVSGTNNSSAGGGTYHLLSSTNITVPLSNWTVVTNSSFDGNGNFSSTNATGTNNTQFYILRVP